MAPSVQTLNSVNYYVSISVGYIIIILGVCGNLTNILVFTQLKLFRKNPSAFFLIVTATVECFLLIFISSSRVLTATVGNDPGVTSLAWCKMRAYLFQAGTTILSTTICFAAIDQYLSTNHQIQMRQISNFKLAQRLVGTLIILAMLYSIPIAVYQNIQPITGCSISNSSYNYYYSFVQLCIVIGLLPIVVSSLFSILSFRNVRRIVRRQIPIIRRRLDRQLTAMILVRVALFVITTLPFVIYRTYESQGLVNTSDPYAVALDQLIRTVITLFNNMDYGGDCYVFLATSSRYRKQVKYLYTKKIWQKLLAIKFNRNQIEPDNQQQNAERHASIEVE